MKLAFVLLALCFCYSIPTCAQAPDDSKILALENAWNQAQLHHDASAVSQLLSENFIYTDYDGSVMNKDQFLADLKDQSYQASLINNEDVKVQAYKEAAVVVGTYHTRGKYKNKPFEHWGRFTDTWIFANGTWVCVASHTTLLKKHPSGSPE